MKALAAGGPQGAPQQAPLDFVGFDEELLHAMKKFLVLLLLVACGSAMDDRSRDAVVSADAERDAGTVASRIFI
ncbi:MAG: hypothetical protein AAF243_08170 [Cyanobacteria bacterium P01_A01_bin.137]